MRAVGGDFEILEFKDNTDGKTSTLLIECPGEGRKRKQISMVFNRNELSKIRTDELFFLIIKECLK